MKKSKLRKIIRESIKDILSEQTGCTYNTPNAISCGNALSNWSTFGTPGTPGITPQFVNVITNSLANGNCCPSYQKLNQLMDALDNLILGSGASGQLCCDGQNPMQQVRLLNKITYIHNQLQQTNCSPAGCVINGVQMKTAPQSPNYTFKGSPVKLF